MDLLLTPRRSPTVHYRYTHGSSALPEGPLEGLPFLCLTTKGSWIHLWGGSLSLSSALWRQYPRQFDGNC